VNGGQSQDFNKVAPGWSFFRVVAGPNPDFEQAIDLFPEWSFLKPGHQYKIRILAYHSSDAQGVVARAKFESLGGAP
jgi:hypothetical protein